MFKKMRTVGILAAIMVLYLGCFSTGVASAPTVPLPILMYHQINPDPAAWGDYTISPEMFEADLKYLSNHGYTSVTAQQLIDYSQGKGQLPAKPVLITFDDGYESFAPYALPLLKEYHMHAVFSMIGKCADIYTERFDHDLSYSFFSWPALSELSKSPWVEVASHTYDLHSMSDARKGCKINPGEDVAAYKALLNADFQRLEGLYQQNLGMTPTIFAYPSGRYCTEAREVLVSRGYKVLFTTDQRVNQLTGTPEELLDLGRYNRAATLSCEQIFQKLHLN